jgi:hypothetical protein
MTSAEAHLLDRHGKRGPVAELLILFRLLGAELPRAVLDWLLRLEVDEMLGVEVVVRYHALYSALCAPATRED